MNLVWCLLGFRKHKLLGIFFISKPELLLFYTSRCPNWCRTNTTFEHESCWCTTLIATISCVMWVSVLFRMSAIINWVGHTRHPGARNSHVLSQHVPRTALCYLPICLGQPYDICLGQPGASKDTVTINNTSTNMKTEFQFPITVTVCLIPHHHNVFLPAPPDSPAQMDGWQKICSEDELQLQHSSNTKWSSKTKEKRI